MSWNEYDLIFKIILIGDSGVGKTNILSQYIKQQFYKDSKATVGVEFGSKIIQMEKTKIKAQIWDTAGQERYRSITSTYYKGSKGCLVVYDVTRPSTFESIQRWVEEMRASADKKIQIILVGNKIDLKENIAVKTEEGENKAKNLDIGFIETSALDYESVDKAFDMMIKNIYTLYKNNKRNNSNGADNGIITEDDWDLEKGNDIRFLEREDNTEQNIQQNKKCDC